MSILKKTILAFCGGHPFSSLCCPIMCLEFRAVMSVMISSYTRCPARLYLQLFVSYLRYLCLLAHSGVLHKLCCVFALVFIVLCTLCCKIIWIVHAWVPLQYSLTFIQSYSKTNHWTVTIYLSSSYKVQLYDF